MSRRRCRDQRGQAIVETVAVLPVVVILLLAVAQVALVVRDQILVVHAAREAGRAAAVSSDPGAARQAALGSVPLDPGRLTVQRSPRGARGTTVTVTVRYRAPTTVALVGALVGDVTLTSTSRFRVEG